MTRVHNSTTTYSVQISEIECCDEMFRCSDDLYEPHGFNIVSWNDEGVAYWAILAELNDFAKLYREPL